MTISIDFFLIRNKYSFGDHFILKLSTNDISPKNDIDCKTFYYSQILAQIFVPANPAPCQTEGSKTRYK